MGLDRGQLQAVAAGYDFKKIKLGAIASHSALDIFDGAKDEGLSNIAICQRGRETPYTRYFRSAGERGCVDEAVVLEKFSDVLSIQERLVRENVLFVPNRSLSAYVGTENLENQFAVPFVGSRNLLKMEEREDEKHNYYTLLEKAGLPFPPRVKNIDGLVIVKLPHAKMKLERGFFTAASQEEFDKKTTELMKLGHITQESLDKARIEKYIIGPIFNFNFFYSPLEEKHEKIELLGVDWRFETNLDGFVRLTAQQQLKLNEKQKNPIWTVCGHNSATIRESLLNKVFPLAEKFVDAVAKHYAPGMIGAFCLQTAVDENLNFYIYDVAPRIGGGTNVHVSLGHPYGNSLWRKPMSSGRRTALEVKRAIESERLEEIVT